MIELMLPHLSAAALLAVAGAAHCVGMCGGIGTALTFT
ncbi:MAG TPA: sulfite exporter TauE/SafE family protein, partial [Alcanivorax sp.]|nr:sulfite exporter TauE/SafE family protein [Alcanivorax sp.]